MRRERVLPACQAPRLLLMKGHSKSPESRAPQRGPARMQLQGAPHHSRTPSRLIYKSPRLPLVVKVFQTPFIWRWGDKGALASLGPIWLDSSIPLSLSLFLSFYLHLYKTLFFFSFCWCFLHLRHRFCFGDVNGCCPILRLTGILQILCSGSLEVTGVVNSWAVCRRSS